MISILIFFFLLLYWDRQVAWKLKIKVRNTAWLVFFIHIVSRLIEFSVQLTLLRIPVLYPMKKKKVFGVFRRCKNGKFGQK